MRRKAELDKNGNPPPIFDVNKRTEFRVTLRPTTGIGDNGAVISPSGEINAPSGEINGERKIIGAIEANPGIKREGLLLETQIPLRTIDHILRRLRRKRQDRVSRLE